MDEHDQLEHARRVLAARQQTEAALLQAQEDLRRSEAACARSSIRPPWASR